MRVNFNKVPCGFSLVELLIALAIMSMTIMISSMGYAFFMEKWQGKLGKFDYQAVSAKNIKLIQNAIDNVYPYILRDETGKASIYFEGDKDNFVAVTSRSIADKSVPAIIRLSVNQADDLSYYIRYQEAQISGQPLISLQQKINFSREFNMFEKAQDIEIRYYGYKNLTEMSGGGEQQWWQTFNSLQRDIMPSKLKFVFVMRGQQQTIEFNVSQVDFRLLNLFNEDF